MYVHMYTCTYIFTVHGPSLLSLTSVPDRDVMCLPALKQNIYTVLLPAASRAIETVEARLNVIQTVFLTLQTKAEPTPDLLSSAQQMFQTLFNTHFTEDIEVNSTHIVHVLYCIQYAHTFACHRGCMSLLISSFTAIQLKTKCPRLENVIKVVLKAIFQTSSSPSVHRKNHQVQFSSTCIYS